MPLLNYCPTCRYYDTQYMTSIGVLDFETLREADELGVLAEWVICLNCGEAVTLD